MKLNRFIVILVAMAMSMLIVQGALATDADPTGGPEVAAEGSPLDEILASIEADRAAVVDDLVNTFATDDTAAYQLRATLDDLSSLALAEVAQNATSLEDVNAILAGTEGILALGDLDKDYVYTPVTPCRIIDTRAGGGGVFFPGQAREYYVYGPFADIGPQGGNPAGCPSPRGEPRGVHINVTAVPQSGQGNFRAYPANVGPPNASLVNYRAGVQNVANAGTIKTFFTIGPREIEFLNSFGTAHLVVDVLGYYHEANPVSGVAPGLEFQNSGSGVTSLSNVLQTRGSLNVTAPASGYIYAIATGDIDCAPTAFAEVGLRNVTTNTTLADVDLQPPQGTPIGGVGVGFAVSGVFSVGAGTDTIILQARCSSGTGEIEVVGFTAMYFQNRY